MDREAKFPIPERTKRGDVILKELHASNRSFQLDRYAAEALARLEELEQKVKGLEEYILGRWEPNK